MMSDKCAPALDVSVEEQDSFGSFGEDSVQTLLSLALDDPEHAKERFRAYRLTRLVTARFDMDDTEAPALCSNGHRHGWVVRDG